MAPTSKTANRRETSSAIRFLPSKKQDIDDANSNGFRGFEREGFGQVVRHLLGLRKVAVEEWPRVADALALHQQGLDFADALHLCASAHCDPMYSFDDRRLARRVKRIGLKTRVAVPNLE